MIVKSAYNFVFLISIFRFIRLWFPEPDALFPLLDCGYYSLDASPAHCITNAFMGYFLRRQPAMKRYRGLVIRGYPAVSLALFVMLLGFFLSGCASRQLVSGSELQVVVRSDSSDPITTFAPVFVLPGAERPYNRIGKVVAQVRDGEEHINIDPDHPVLYTGSFRFRTARGSYLNQVYRVHFQKTPWSLVPFHLGAGSNVGLLVVVTLSEDRVPLLVTTVNTCGCYIAVIPTGSLPPEDYPRGWKSSRQSVYGEILPGLLPIYSADDVLLVTVRPEVHRVMDVRIVPRRRLMKKETVQAQMLTLQSLKVLPLADDKTKTTSLYYDAWPLRGHVKGAIKPMESLLLGFVSLDFYVGMDKEYGDTAVSGNPFYTSLLPWNRHTSDMNDFAGFLKFMGWRL